MPKLRLRDLLLSLYTDGAALRRGLGEHLPADLVNDVAWHLSFGAVVADLVDALARHGRIDRDLFDVLLAAFPARRADIDAVEAAFLPSSPADTWDVFLAHAAVDKPAIRPLAAALRAHDLRVFLDEDSIPIGAEWDLFILAAQAASRATVLCLSAAYEQAFYERSEAHRAIALKRAGAHQLLPVRLGPCGDVLYGLNLLHAIDLAALGVGETAARIAAHLRTGPAAAAPPPAAAPSNDDPLAVHEVLCRFTATTFDEVVFYTGFPRGRLLPAGQPQTLRAINLIEHAAEADAMAALIAAIRKARPGAI